MLSNRTLGFVLAFVASISFNAHATCSVDDILKMKNGGMTDARIKQLCKTAEGDTSTGASNFTGTFWTTGVRHITKRGLTKEASFDASDSGNCGGGWWQPGSSPSPQLSGPIRLASQSEEVLGTPRVFLDHHCAYLQGGGGNAIAELDGDGSVRIAGLVMYNKCNCSSQRGNVRLSVKYDLRTTETFSIPSTPHSRSFSLTESASEWNFSYPSLPSGTVKHERRFEIQISGSGVRLTNDQPRAAGYGAVVSGQTLRVYKD